jgi:hypothetical protein
MSATLDRLLPWLSLKHGHQTMKQHVEAYKRSGDMWRRNKSSSQKPAGLLQPLTVLDGTWTSIGVDVVADLPMSERGHDMLMVVVNRFTNGVHLLPPAKNLKCRRLCTAADGYIILINYIIIL